MDFPRIDPNTLARMETLATGQADDLKHEVEYRGTVLRYWLARTGSEDGQEYAVEVEQLTDEGWVIAGRYGDPDDVAFNETLARG